MTPELLTRLKGMLESYGVPVAAKAVCMMLDEEQKRWETLTAERDRYRAALEKIKYLYYNGEVDRETPDDMSEIAVIALSGK